MGIAGACLTAHLEITSPGEGKRTVPIWHGTFVLGADRAADVQVAWPGVRPQHLRFVPVEGMVRVEPVAAGATIEVNGEQLFSKDLRDGDVITIGALQIRWVDAQARPLAPVRAASPARAAVQAANTMPSGGRAGVAPPSAASRSARKGGRSAKGAAKEDPRERARSERSGRRSGASSWGIVSAAVMVVMLLGYGLLQHFKNSTWPSSPQHYVDLAREQLGNRQPERALATLAFALKDATGAVRVQAEQLDADIRQLLLETAAMPKVLVARTESDKLREFTARYLKAAAGRPAARELVRRCDRWLASYRDLCANHSDGKEPLRAVEELRGRFAAVAQLDTAEEVADVMFFVEERLGLRWRDYKAALARIDAFAEANPGAAEVVQKRTELLVEGEKWLRGKLDNIGHLIERGDVTNAKRDLEEIELKVLVPAWEPLVAPVRARVAAAR